MGKYCCFTCPSKDYSEKKLSDQCPTCGKTYGFPLTNPPAAINQYKIVKALGRGFYAATFVAERGALKSKVVLKVSPKEFFTFFPGKDFSKECADHARVAEGTEHIVAIRDMLEADVDFGGVIVPSYIAELDHIDGHLLESYLDANASVSARSVAQIAIDLLKIRSELQAKSVNHNDLHAGNIIVQKLRPDARRVSSIDDSIRAVAIDLGSIADASKSNPEKTRLGDLHWIAAHLESLVGNLLRYPDRVSDLDNRLASALQLIIHSVSSNVENQRTPSASDLITQIEEAYHRSAQHWRPWGQPLILKNFDSSYNAQTMHAWHVPHLLVDPHGTWLNRISSQGPQVITGMRGCGKTMLLRALQFHARAAQQTEETSAKILHRISSDSYVGLFVSAQRLLDRIDPKEQVESDPFARLFVAYALEAVRALFHLRDLQADSVTQIAYREIAQVIASSLDYQDIFVGLSSLEQLENRLSYLLISLSRGDRSFKLPGHPGNTFPMLAEAVRRSTSLWESKQIFFLLDDVSTRYLSPEKITQLLSALLFQNQSCAFKLTSEVQTMELGLKSPGGNHPARVGRDLAVFDLGAEVYEKIKKLGKENGSNFVESILLQRVKHFSDHPSVKPSALLGDVPLETIAMEIGASASGSKKRKSIYRGITALSRMCVGDIGDVISLYESILRRASDKAAFPISAEIQSECFQDFCARRLYDLNRRGGYLKDVAKSFAEASNELLVRSCAGEVKGPRRIRQYSSLYVRITTGNLDEQIDKLRDLIDAGVFVFAGGSNVPRAKTRDANPTQQFKLTYRKIYGLVNFIGLAERDRFELSGPDLEEWLEHPSKGREILLRNLGGETADDDDVENVETVNQGEEIKTVEPETASVVPQQQSFLTLMSPSPTRSEAVVSKKAGESQAEDAAFLFNRPQAKELTASELSRLQFDCAVVGLGFEARTLESAQRLHAMCKPKSSLLIKYTEPGYGDQIRSLTRSSGSQAYELEYINVVKTGLPAQAGNVLIDITGLAKPVIFHAVRNQLLMSGKVWICHTGAETYYPLESDLDKILQADENKDRHALLEELSHVLTGEDAPYSVDNLLTSDSDETRQRVLCAFSSAKHERLLSLLDRREYDRIEIVAPTHETARGRVAQMAAEVAAKNNQNSNIQYIDSNNIEGVLNYLGRCYRTWYVDHGLNFEIGLTGSKLQAVAAAAVSASCKVSQCWYVRPKSFDPDRFTVGIGRTAYYEITLSSTGTEDVYTSGEGAVPRRGVAG